MSVPTHSLTVDVEEYFHAATLDGVIGPARWHAMPSRVERSTERLLDLLAEYQTRGTFFILGCVARRTPQLVKKIADTGHEVASHGYAHRLAYEQSPAAFRRDVRKSKFLLEELTGKEVLGYRAPNFSIVDRNQWAYDELLASGYTYDSSVYPTWHPRYTNLNKPTKPYRVKRRAGELLVFPLSTTTVKLGASSFRLPIAGGAYWRFFPTPLLAWGLARAVENEVVNCYLHPWDLDYEQPQIAGLSPLARLRHYGGAKKLEHKLRRFLRTFRFSPLIEVASRYY